MIVDEVLVLRLDHITSEGLMDGKEDWAETAIENGKVLRCLTCDGLLKFVVHVVHNPLQDHGSASPTTGFTDSRKRMCAPLVANGKGVCERTSVNFTRICPSVETYTVFTSGLHQAVFMMLAGHEMSVVVFETDNEEYLEKLGGETLRRMACTLTVLY